MLADLGLLDAFSTHLRDSWRNGVHSPVLKHGPGSFTFVQVKEWKARWRNEIEEYIEVASRKVFPSPGLSITERYEDEHKGRDPKDGELYLSRMKPGETLVEVRRGTDVQIVRPT